MLIKGNGMLRYLGDDKYETHLESGEKITLTKKDVENVVMSSIEIIDHDNIVTEHEDYQMLISENKYLAEYLKHKVGLKDEQISTLANTGYIK